MSSTPLVLSTVANSVAHVVMNRPECDECHEPGDDYGTAPGTGAGAERSKCIDHCSFRCAGSNFCAGDDLKEGGAPERR